MLIVVHWGWYVANDFTIVRRPQYGVLYTEVSLIPRAENFATARRGLSWSMVASLATLLASVCAQFVLGHYLSDRDFGVYAIAFSLANFLVVFKDGGVSRWLTRLTPDEFDRSAGASLGLATVSCLVVGLVISLLAIPVSRLYGQPLMTPIMLILSVAFAISPYNIIGLARLNVDLRFQAMAWVKLISGVTRYSVTILLAIRGFGALSLAWPVVIITLVETGLYAFLTRIPLSVIDISPRSLTSMMRRNRWSIAGAFAESIYRQVDYAIIGLWVPIETVGNYYFAFQLAMKPVTLFGENLRRVVMPLFSRIADDPERAKRSLSYGAIFVGLIATPAFFAFAVAAEPLLTLLWGQKWHVSIHPLQILLLVMPIQLVVYFIESVAQSRSRFKSWTMALAIRSIGLIATCLGIAAFTQTPSATQLAILIGFYIVTSGVIEIVALLTDMKLPCRAIFQPLVGPLAVALITALLLIGNAPVDWPPQPAVRAACWILIYVAISFAGLAVFCRPAVINAYRLVAGSRPDLDS